MNMRSLLSTVVAAGLLSIANGAEQPIYPAIKGDLVSLQGKNMHRLDDAPLAGVKYFGIYYSASWCGPCKAFTPKLVEFYNRIKSDNPQFELLFVSHDNSDKEMEAYMKTDSMPWPAIAYNKLKSNKQLASYAGPGIPCLVLVDANGKVLSDSYVAGSYVGPAKVMADIEKTLKANPAGADAKSAASGGVKRPDAQGSNFDDFFKKK
jgi:nucleoredoxin